MPPADTWVNWEVCLGSKNAQFLSAQLPAHDLKPTVGPHRSPDFVEKGGFVEGYLPECCFPES